MIIFINCLGFYFEDLLESGVLIFVCILSTHALIAKYVTLGEYWLR